MESFLTIQRSDTHTVRACELGINRAFSRNHHFEFISPKDRFDFGVFRKHNGHRIVIAFYAVHIKITEKRVAFRNSDFHFVRPDEFKRSGTASYYAQGEVISSKNRFNESICLKGKEHGAISTFFTVDRKVTERRAAFQNPNFSLIRPSKLNVDEAVSDYA